MRNPLRRLSPALTLAFLAAGAQAQAPALDIALVLHGPPVAAPGLPVALRAVPASPGAGPAPGQPVESKAVAPGASRLVLDRSIVWRISAEAPGYWAAPLESALPAGASALTLDLWPAGRLAGAVRMAPGEKAPPELAVRFRPSPERGKAAPFPEHTEVCPIVDGAWSCRLPAGKFDLRLRARGFVSHYRWGVAVQTGETLALGTLALQRGASVVGRVEASEGAVSPKSCKVELSPLAAGLGTSPEEIERRAGLALAAPVDERGFFHFEGVKPGAYSLQAEQLGFAPARLYPVSVFAGAESEVRQPLLLVPPLTLEAFLEPPLDPWNHRWKVQLDARSAVPGSLTSLGKAAASEDGRFAKSGLAPGEYVLEVQDSRGAGYAWEEVALDRATAPLRVKIPLVWVEGKIRLGDEPLQASLWFGGRNGKVQVLLRSGAGGEFAGALPHAGQWDVDVEGESLPVRRRVRKVAVEPREGTPAARADIDLPATAVDGEVVDASDHSVSGARVTAFEFDTARPIFLTSDEKGRFRLAGVPAGRLTLTAEAAGAQSEAAIVEVAEGATPPPVRLQLRSGREVTGTVTSPAGGIPGARVFVIPMNRNATAFLPASVQAMTDIEGKFRLKVPATASDLLLLALPPGYALVARRFAGIPQEPLTVLVEPQGGTLHLRPADPGDPEDPRSERLTVWVNGIALDVNLLQSWAAMNGVRNQDPSRLVAPQLPAGGYTACWSTMAAAWESLPAGAMPASATCVSGTLAPAGELRLERPPPAANSRGK
jgi:carboxypeptidase family protein